MRTYWSSIEFNCLEGAEHYGKCSGGFVYAFVPAQDVRDALPKFMDELGALHLRIIQIEFVSPYEDIPWDTTEEQRKYDALAQEAGQTGQVVLDAMYIYENP